jgi:adenylate cyclase
LIDEVFFNAGSQQSPQYLSSPFHAVEQLGELYATIRPAGEDQPFPVFADLAAAGCTSYYGKRLKGFAGMLQKIGIATRVPGGLRANEVGSLRWAVSLLTLHLNTLIEYSVKNTLARVYIGQDSGARVCSGMISIGQVISLEGAIWFSDLRGFTEASERLSPEELIRTLNDYMGVVVDAIYANGGEVLKYIGDAVMAVFPTRQLGGPTPACRAALAAAEAVEAGLADLNATRRARSDPPLKQGVGLHYGETRYGNIGTLDRLDFTVIGQAVNVASRIEGINKELDRSPLCSAVFAEAAGVEMERLGSFPLRGVTGETMLYTPA